MVESVFLQVGCILGAAAFFGLLSRSLRQPLIVSFIAIGILLGPSALGVVVPSSEIELFARLGIALLLFVVGLKLDLHVIRTVGPVALASGLGQVFFTTVIGYLLALALGMGTVAAIYVAVALTFSSTIIIVKLLSDKREVETLHGRIAIGFLIVQDIVVVLVMISLTAFGEAAGSTSVGAEALSIVIKGLGLLLSVYLLTRFILPWLLPRLAHSSELLLLFAMSMAVLGGAAGDALGFSKEVGAFLAGVSLASTAYREQIAARLVSLRDFLLLFFFIELGATIDLSNLGAQVGGALLLSLFVLIGNPLIVMSIMGFMGYRKRTGFLAGLTVAQISEFSLVLAALGFSLGHIDQNTVGLIALVGLITISASTYMILFSHDLYAYLGKYMSVFERRNPFRETRDEAPSFSADVLVIGLGRYGCSLAEKLNDEGFNILGVDIDPHKVEHFRARGIPVAYGDVSDPEFLSALPLGDLKWVVCTVRDDPTTRLLMQGLKSMNCPGKVAVAVASNGDSMSYPQVQADLLLTPYADAAESALQQIRERLHKQPPAPAAATSSAA